MTGLAVEMKARTGLTPSRRSCEAAALLGMSFDEEAREARAQRVELALKSGTVTLVTGPSGAGKSTLLRGARDEAKARGWRVIDVNAIRLGASPAVQLAGRDVESALSRLADVGLAEARLAAQRPHAMSEGQRARLRIAVALHRASRGPMATPTLIVIDEFAQSLDRTTARSVAMGFARALKRALRVRAVVATSHDDLETALRPAQVVRVSMRGDVTVRRGAPGAAPDRYDIEIGTPADYTALAHWHHRSGRPASIVRTLRAVDALTGELTGVAVIAMPTLNGVWRDIAWPGRYSTGDKRVNARRLNAEVRRIARVVVEPRHRGVGLARRLVDAYLNEPLTVRTEAVATVARFSRFFERAGMRAIDLPLQARDARLLDAMEHAGVEPFRLATPGSAWRRAVASTSEAFMERELRRWSQDRGAETQRFRTRRDLLWKRACCTVAARMRAYVSEAWGGEILLPREKVASRLCRDDG